MTECQCNITNGMLSPGVFNIKQYLNETEEMRWTVSSRFLTGGVDLADCDAFLVLQRGDGEPDEVLLTKTVNNDQTITLLWDVGTYATWLTGYVKYQIVFRGATLTEIKVLTADNEDAGGIYEIDNATASDTMRTWTNKDNSSYTIRYNTDVLHWELQKDGVAIDWQIIPNSEPYGGLWHNAYIGNASAFVWMSSAAVMYISGSIAADETVAAKFPTILRQMYLNLKDLIVKAGVSAYQKDITADDWQGGNAQYYIDVAAIIEEEIPANCTIANAIVYQKNDDGTHTAVECANFVLEQGKYGGAKVYSDEKITGRLAITIKAGNGYCFIKEDAFGNLLEVNTSAVTSVNGKIGEVILRAADFGMCSKEDIDLWIANLRTDMTAGDSANANAIAALATRLTAAETNITNLQTLVGEAAQLLAGV